MDPLNKSNPLISVNPPYVPLFTRVPKQDPRPKGAGWNPKPPAPDPTDAYWRAIALADVEKVIAVTIAVTAIARWVPGPIGVAASMFSVALLGTEGETKKGNLGGAKTNVLPPPFGFVDPKVYGLKPNFWLPEGSTQAVPKYVDLFGLGLNEQRVEDRTAADRAKLDQMRKLKADLASLPYEEWKKQDWTRPQGFAKPFALSWYFGNYQNVELSNIAVLNERLYRAQPRLRHAVDNSGWIPLDVIESDRIDSLIAWNEAVLAGSLQPEKIDPVNAKAIENAELAEGIRRELVSERADP